MPPCRPAPRAARVVARWPRIPAPIGHRYVVASCGLLLALALAIMLAVSLRSLLEPGAASAAGEHGGGALVLVPAHDRSLSGAALQRSSPPREDE